MLPRCQKRMGFLCVCRAESRSRLLHHQWKLGIIVQSRAHSSKLYISPAELFVVCFPKLDHAWNVVRCRASVTIIIERVDGRCMLTLDQLFHTFWFVSMEDVAYRVHKSTVNGMLLSIIIVSCHSYCNTGKQQRFSQSQFTFRTPIYIQCHGKFRVP